MDVLVHGISGSISGLTAILVWYPLETLRMREQTDVLGPSRPSSTLTENDKQSIIYAEQNIPHKLRAFLLEKLHSVKLASDIISNEGISGLYNGMSSAMVGSVITSGIYFLTYKLFKDTLIQNKFTRGIIVDSMITSLLASCCTAIGSNPIWVLNSRMSKSKKETKEMTNLQMVLQIYKEEGIGGFYKGLVPSLFLTANPVIQFVLYEFLRVKLADLKGNISVFNIILISIVSKLITTLVTYPILTIKTLFQANEKRKNSEILEILTNLFHNEGVKGFYKGIFYDM